ncbi:MAG: nuclear transport factor 2 family protein, partial [Syntrophales bacterium LBB04]|nr:nuclear transport factor 2 family protein [Syntrophales bacterium LBB04]
HFIYGLVLFITLAFFLALAPSANAASAEDEVLQVVTNFAKAATTNDTELMSSLWWNSPKTSTFGPPKGMAFLYQGYETIMMWMKDLNKYPVGTNVRTIHDPQVTMLGDNVAVITAYSIFIQNPPIVKEQTTSQERMTFVVQKIGGKCLIVHGHGSAFPTE